VLTANGILGCALIAIWGWQLARRLLPRIMDRAAARHGQPGAHRQARLIEAGEWRDSWYPAVGILSGIVILASPSGPVRWVVLGVQIAIMIVTFPVWNAGAWLRRRRDAAADDQARA
jgi:hypothetical protein